MHKIRDKEATLQQVIELFRQHGFIGVNTYQMRVGLYQTWFTRGTFKVCVCFLISGKMTLYNRYTTVRECTIQDIKDYLKLHEHA